MNEQTLHKTRSHLTRMFTGIVVCLMLIVGIVFLTARYVTESHRTSEQFTRETRQIFTTAASAKNFLESFGVSQPVGNPQNSRRGVPKFGRAGPNKVSFFVLDADEHLIFKNLLESPEFENLDFPENTLQKLNGQYVIRYTTQTGNNFVFYDSMRDVLGDYLRDIAILFGIIALFGLGVYVIGYQFMGRALRPVEDNLRDMSEFIHNAGHELKTPLAVMRGNLQVMQAEKKLDPKLLKTSLGQIDETNKLIEGLRELSEVGKISNTHALAIASTIKKVVGELHPLAEKKDITIDDQSQGSLIVQSNQQELEVLLSNLLKNAIKYTPEGGDIHIRLTKNILEIQDTGIGIEEEDQKKIFNRFYQGSNIRSQEGFGIGLSLVKKIAETNGWKIEFDSIPGEGSVFRVIF